MLASVHFFGKKRQETVTENQQGRCPNAFKNKKKLQGQAITASCFISPKCKDGLGAISECAVWKRDSIFPRIYGLIKAFESSQANEYWVYSNYFWLKPRVAAHSQSSEEAKLVQLKHLQQKRSRVQNQASVPRQRLLLPVTEEWMSKILDKCSLWSRKRIWYA